MRLQTSNVRECLIPLLSPHRMREFVVWIPILFLCFCTLWSHYAALCAHIMLRRDSFGVSLGRRCRPRDSCLQSRDQLERAWQYRPRLGVTHTVFCYPGLGLIDRNFIITKSVQWAIGPGIQSRGWIRFLGAPLFSDPGSRGSQPSRRGLKRRPAVIGQEMGGGLWLVETNRWMFPLASRAW